MKYRDECGGKFQCLFFEMNPPDPPKRGDIYKIVFCLIKSYAHLAQFQSQACLPTGRLTRPLAGVRARVWH